MKSIALQKARRRLAEAETSLGRLVSPALSFGVPETFQEEWSRFLTALDCIPEILRTGSRASPQSQQWFGGQRQIILHDPLTRYLHHARGVDFHGIEQVSNMVLGPGQFVGYDNSHKITMVDAAGTKTISSDAMVFRDVGRLTAGMKLAFCLLPVEDRHGNLFDPPTEHLGAPIDDLSPSSVGRLGLSFYRSLIAAAASRTGQGASG